MKKYRLNPSDDDNFIIQENFDKIVNEAQGKMESQKYFTFLPSEHKNKDFNTIH